MARKRTTPAAIPEVKITMKDIIISMFKSVLNDILQHKHTHYVFKGGRGSTKSSFIAVMIILLMIAYKDIHVVVFRKVGNTIKNSVFSQVIWAIEKLGLTQFFKIPKSISSPIVFLPTGQQILFMGLDDPNKVKSVKLPFGYIGITWFEELDQFSGEAEIRKVLQSTMRGGPIFWDFRSFNPPISNLNWANQYALDALSRTNTLVTSNTYLDVPEDWLGQAFIDEALDLKATNPRAYEHEYLGVPVGTGGNVFENVKPLYMTDEFISHFDHVYNGLDWGWYPDPLAFNKCHFDAARRILYIFAEYRTNRTSNADAYKYLYKDSKLYHGTDDELAAQGLKQRPFMLADERLTADSAEPKSISDFKAYGGYGCRGAEKGPDSVVYSMKWLQSLAAIYIDPVRCPGTLKEFADYEYERDKDDEIVSGYPDLNNHDIDAIRYSTEIVWKRRGQ